MMPFTSVPQTPEFIKGVINLCGKAIPVVELRLRFGMASMDYNERTCIIVVEIDGTAQTIQISIVVDSVSVVESGCGKSTIARSLVSLQKPTAGKILFDSEDLTRNSRDRVQAIRPQIQNYSCKGFSKEGGKIMKKDSPLA